MRKLFLSSKPDLIYKPAKEGAVLEEDYEDFQTINIFKNDKERNKPTNKKRFCHIYYVGEIPNSFQKIIKQLFKYISSVFCIPVLFKGILKIEKKSPKLSYLYSTNSELFYKIKTRSKKSSKQRMNIKSKNKNIIYEFDAQDIIGSLLNFFENDTLTILGITAHNIYNSEMPDDIIMGLSCGNGASIVSVTECFDMTIKEIKNREKNGFFELMKTTAHELSHTLGIDHCVEYNCLMNSQYVKESYKNPIYFCPFCLYKLYLTIKFDPLERWNNLYKFFISNDMKASADWVKKRVSLWKKDLKNQ